MSDSQYSVLLIDDEQHVTDTLQALLCGRNDLSLYVANLSTQALSILSSTRIDLMICDICMPEISGLELIQYANALQPDCRTIFLTGYSDFTYAQAALNSNAAKYVLKSQPDQVLLHAVDQVLHEIHHTDMIRELIRRTDAYMTLPEAFNHPLFTQRGMKIGLDALNLSAVQDRSLLLYASSTGHELRSIADALLEYLGIQVERSQLFACEKELLWVLTLIPGQARTLVLGLLEKWQNALLESKQISVSFVVSPFLNECASLQKTLLRIVAFTKENQNLPMYVYLLREQPEAYDPISRVVHYIEEHIAEEITMLQLSTLTGYNADYLNRIFKQKTGKPISSYIAGKRVDVIIGLMRNPALSIEHIAKMTGFSTRSYFNRFFKSATGSTPSAYRKDLKTL